MLSAQILTRLTFLLLNPTETRTEREVLLPTIVSEGKTCASIGRKS